jgi:GTPase SAR1 family protein
MVDNINNDYTIDNGTSLSMTRHKIVFIGDVATGKTSIINRFLDNNFKDNYDVTINKYFIIKAINRRRFLF